MRAFVLPIILTACAAASVPVRDACGEDATIVANLQDSDGIQIRHGVFGEAVPCYAVSATQGGKEVHGFILGNTLPAIQEFERARALESRVPVPAPPPAPGEKPAAHPTGAAFEAWSGVDLDGKKMQIVADAAKATLVTFWAPQSSAARRHVQNLTLSVAVFMAKGVRSYGLVEAATAGRAEYYLDSMSLDGPQALDRQKLAAKYNADAMKGTTLVLDSSNHIVLASSNLTEIRAAVARLLSLE